MKENHNNDIQPETPGLNRAGKNRVFLVPDGYFEKLPIYISDRISQQKPVSFIDLIVGYLQSIPKSIAIITVLVFLISSISIYLTIKDKGQQTLEEPFQFTEFIDSGYLDELDGLFIINNLPENSIADNNNIGYDPSLEQYLIENKIELNQLINEL
jgi:hypothetical protein